MIALLNTVYAVGTHCYLIWLHLDIAMDVEFMFYVHRLDTIRCMWNAEINMSVIG